MLPDPRSTQTQPMKRPLPSLRSTRSSSARPRTSSQPDAYDCVYAYKQALENAGATPDMSAEDLCDKMIEQFTSMTFDA